MYIYHNIVMNHAMLFCSVWESTGGCFWVCAEELFRHHILQQIRQTITISEDFLNSHEVVIALRALVVKRIPEVMPRIQHQLLHRRIQELRCQLLTFFNRLYIT